MNCSQHLRRSPPSSQVFTSAGLRPTWECRYNTEANMGCYYGVSSWCCLSFLFRTSYPRESPQILLSQATSPSTRKRFNSGATRPTPTPPPPTMPSPANITGIFLDTTASRPNQRDSPPIAFDRHNRYTLSLAIKKKMNICQSGPGQARMHP